MKTINKIPWKRIVTVYFSTLLSALLVFIPIDLIVYKSYIKLDASYFFENLLELTPIIIIFIIIIPIFNNAFFSKKIFIRIILEISCSIVITTFILYLIELAFFKNIQFSKYIYIRIKDKSFFTSAIESIFIILVIEATYQYHKRKDDAIEKERLKYLQLKSDINPHFLFNSLNMLSSMCYTNEPKETSKYISKLGDVYRYVLMNEEKTTVQLKDELKFIYQYVDILKAIYSDCLILDVQLNEEDEEKNILAMSIQLLVENVVKHNIISQGQPLIINIYVEKDYIIVKNNKNIKKEENRYYSTSIGLKNLNTRYNIITKKNIIIINKEKSFTVKIPLI